MQDGATPGVPLLTAVALVSGCGGISTTTKDARVGDTLTSGGLKVTVLKTDGNVPRPDGDVTVRPRLPQRSYADAFGVLRSGCEAGWIVFEIPSSDRAEAVKFTHDDTGSARPRDTERHARFTWKLGD